MATRYGQQAGGYYLGVTRDDIGGLAYLYRPNNFAYETLDSNSTVLGSSSTTWNPVNTGETNSAGTTNFQGIFGGVNKITYLKVGFDSLLGTAFTPITYTYTIPVVTNGRLESLHVARTVTQPDIIFAAGDLTVEPFNVTPNNYPNPYIRTFGFGTNGLVTTGVNAVTATTISPQEIITFNDAGPAYFNENPSFLDSQQFIIYPTLQWASFNGSTNAPVLYPNEASIVALEQQVLTPNSSVPLGIYNPVTTNSTTNTSGTGTGTTTTP